ncbi:MAG: N-acetylglucosamine-6-phosphate deacetylase [Clostridia bacterium]|nr:N-acetylglucosamine-6-phosphate deacetylase [Clostridia bacterium]
MKDIYIVGGRVVVCDGEIETSVKIHDGKLELVSEMPDNVENATVIDAKGSLVLPGFIDLHVHGGGGSDFMDLTPEAFKNAVNTHAWHGTTSIMPTTLSAPLDDAVKFLALYKTIDESELNATLLGVHLEGPFLSPYQSGAQNKSHLALPTRENYMKLSDAGLDVIGQIDIAPELEGAFEAAEYFSGKGKLVSIAHSAALYPCVSESVSHGFSRVTHLHCASPWARKIDERLQAGIPEAAYLIDEMGFELIGDGYHIAPQTIEMAAKFKKKGRVVLVTDAMRAAGQDVTESYLGAVSPDNRVIIEGGVAKLPDRSSFAGSIATMESVFRNVYNNTRLPAWKIAELMSLAPAMAAGVDKTKGSIEDGKDADIVIASADSGELQYVIARGKIIRGL